MVYLLVVGPPPRSPLFPYTTLFRSRRGGGAVAARGSGARGALPVRRAPLAGHRDRRSVARGLLDAARHRARDRKSTRLNSSHSQISYAVFCLKKKNYTEPEHVRGLP